MKSFAWSGAMGIIHSSAPQREDYIGYPAPARILAVAIAAVVAS